ncbi:MAG: hypothetical protein ACI30Q_07875 [Muribaculaceae bacterium]
MKTLSLEKVNYGNHFLEKKIAEKIVLWDGKEIDVQDNYLVVNGNLFSTDNLESDLLTTTLVSQFGDGTKFRIVRPCELFLQIAGDTITFASMYHDGYAVHFNIV